MTDENLFEEDKPETPVVPNPSQDSFADQLKLIVNEKGEQKYNTVEDAIKALKHSQEYIAQIQGENKSYKELLEEAKAELGSRKSVEDVVNKLYQSKNTNDGEAEETPKQERLDSNTVESLIEQTLRKREEANKYSANKNMVSGELIKKFGDEAKKIINEKLAGIGMNFEQFTKLSAEAPNAALALFNQTSSSPSRHTTSNVNVNSDKREDLSIPKPEKSMLQGATGKDLASNWKQLTEIVHKKMGVEA